MNIQTFGQRVSEQLRRYPVTLLLVAALCAAAVATGTVAGGLSQRLVNRLGFAPADFWAVDLWRMFTSALVTRGRGVFAGAVIMVVVAVGAVERRAGSRWAAAGFWGSHVWTLLLMSLALRADDVAGRPSLSERMATLRDVGPSAGYLGCLGLALATMPNPRLRGAAAVLVVGWLAGDFIGWIPVDAGLAQDLSADLAHLIAFATGWIVGEIATRFAESRHRARRAG